AEAIKRPAAPEQSRSDGDAQPDTLPRPAEQHAGEVGPGDADEGLRPGLAEADLEVADAHAWVDEHDDGAELEQGEGQGVELQAGRHHDHGRNAAADAELVEPTCQAIALTVELGESPAALPPRRRAGRPARLDQRGLVGAASGLLDQWGSDVHGVCRKKSRTS